MERWQEILFYIFVVPFLIVGQLLAKLLWLLYVGLFRFVAAVLSHMYGKIVAGTATLILVYLAYLLLGSR